MNVKELRINHILEKGFELFSEFGIDNVTMNNIAEEANIGVASLYRYFVTKEELAIQCATKMWQTQQEKAQGFFSSKEYLEKNGLSQVESIFQYFESSFDNTQKFYRFIYYFDSYIKRQNIPTSSLQNYEKIIGEITFIAYKAIEKGISDGRVNRRRAEAPKSQKSDSDGPPLRGSSGDRDWACGYCTAVICGEEF